MQTAELDIDGTDEPAERLSSSSDGRNDPTRAESPARSKPICSAAAKRRSTLVGKVLINASLIAAAYSLSFLVRFDFDIPHTYLKRFLITLPLVVLLRTAVLGALGAYRSSWRHVGVSDLVTIVKANTIASGLLLAALFASGQHHGFPGSIIFLDWVMALLLLGGSRLLTRRLNEQPLNRAKRRAAAVPALIVGAGHAGERLIRELHRDPSARFWPVALADDDAAKLGMTLHGVPVLGSTSELADIANSTGAKLAIIAIASISRVQVSQIMERCRKASITCQIVPSLPELLSGAARLSQVRDVQVEDLLGRSPVQLDVSALRRSFAGKVVLITGGAGSIGSELARQVAALNPARLVLVEQAESPLYFVNLELAQSHPEVQVVPIIGDITDRTRMAEIFSAHRPNYVFHAAAYKHVPLMEDNVVEAVRNNVMGTLCLAEYAAAYEAERFVLISTDKAVRPSSVMGATKRIAERLVLGLPTLVGSATDFRAVRFGNVLGSDGSVIPLFKRQLARGEPLTVTHPEVTRYFMTIPEAAQLVLAAGTLPEAAGRITMLEMGEPVKIKDLAENLIRLSGLEPGVDVEIRYAGLRPGEKLYEELMSDVEATVATAVEKIRIVQTDETSGRDVAAHLARLRAALSDGRKPEMLAAICAMVPECVSPLREHGRRAAPPATHGRDAAAETLKHGADDAARPTASASASTVSW